MILATTSKTFLTLPAPSSGQYILQFLAHVGAECREHQTQRHESLVLSGRRWCVGLRKCLWWEIDSDGQSSSGLLHPSAYSIRGSILCTLWIVTISSGLMAFPSRKDQGVGGISNSLLSALLFSEGLLTPVHPSHYSHILQLGEVPWRTVL